jgi:3-deoxy-D-manno-octulosonic-acid transferase
MTPTSYRWLTRGLSPALWLWDCGRAIQQAIYRPYRHERWCKRLPQAVSNKLIWIHAVSVGETQACAPLLRALLLRYPAHAVLLTHMTPTGRDTGAQLFAKEISDQRVQQCYLPYDIAGLPERFLKHFKPVCGVFMETEVWPNCVQAAARLGIPLGLANARLSDKSLRKSLAHQPLASSTYQAFSWVAAQSELDAKRLAQLRSAPIEVTGNLKFETLPNPMQLHTGQAFKAKQADRLTIALASTREGEEALLLQALMPWLAQQSIQPLILLIPRHPKRANELLALLTSLGLNTAQRSMQVNPTADTQVYLCDTLGEMWFYYGASDIAIVGGAWLPLGGQNLIEPCMAGCVTIVGPHMFNFAHATALALSDSALIQCETADLAAQLNDLLNHATRRALSQRAQAFASKHAGATDKHMALIEQTIKQ